MTQNFSNTNTAVVSGLDDFAISIGNMPDDDVAMALLLNEKDELVMRITQKNLPEKCLSQGWDLKDVHLIVTIKSEKGSLYHVIPRTGIRAGSKDSAVPYVPGIDGYRAVCEIFLLNDQLQVLGKNAINMNYPDPDAYENPEEQPEKDPSNDSRLPVSGKDLFEYIPRQLNFEGNVIILEYNKQLFTAEEFHIAVAPLIVKSVVKEICMYFIQTGQNNEQWTDFFKNLFGENDYEEFVKSPSEDNRYEEWSDAFEEGWDEYIASPKYQMAEKVKKISNLLRITEDS